MLDGITLRFFLDLRRFLRFILILSLVVDDNVRKGLSFLVYPTPSGIIILLGERLADHFEMPGVRLAAD